MVEIIVEHVEMPPFEERRYKREHNANGSRWWVVDTQNKNKVVFGLTKFEEASLASHNLNKKYYRYNHFGAGQPINIGMRYVILAFTLKGQDVNQILNVVDKLAATFGPKEDVCLISGHMPRQLVEKKGFDTSVVDKFDALFPNQINFFTEGMGTNRKLMADAARNLGATCYAIGDTKEGVAEEIAYYASLRVGVLALPISWEGGDLTRVLTFGEKAAGIGFNPGGHKAVESIKRKFATVIDEIDYARSNAQSGDMKRYFSTSITYAEIAQMEAVKAITWQHG